jgi:hypothetical protein
MNIGSGTPKVTRVGGDSQTQTAISLLLLFQSKESRLNVYPGIQENWQYLTRKERNRQKDEKLDKEEESEREREQ